MRSIYRRYEGNGPFLIRMQQAADTARGFMEDLNRDLGISLEQVAAEALSSDQPRAGENNKVE